MVRAILIVSPTFGDSIRLPIEVTRYGAVRDFDNGTIPSHFENGIVYLGLRDMRMVVPQEYFNQYPDVQRLFVGIRRSSANGLTYLEADNYFPAELRFDDYPRVRLLFAEDTDLNLIDYR